MSVWIFREDVENSCSPICVFAGLGTMYVRYKQVEALISASESGLQLLNYTGLLMGIFSTVGMCVVANFQVKHTLDTMILLIFSFLKL